MRTRFGQPAFCCSAALLLIIASLLSGVSSLQAQQSRRITDVSLTPTGSVRLVTEPTSTTPDLLLLESADSPLGPWWKEPDFQRSNTVNGYEFITPRKPYNPQRFYRIAPFETGTLLPYIRFIAPNDNVRPGLSVSLLGANFNPNPSGNTVRFERPGQSATGLVTQAGSNYIVVTVPTNLLTASTGLLYRVTVTTSQGVANGVGCKIYSYPPNVNTFSLRPANVYVIQPPGTGKDTLIVGGGVPPYRLFPQTSNEMRMAVATLNGPVLTVTATAPTNVLYGNVTVSVADSSTQTQYVSAVVYVVRVPFAPAVDLSFHTLLEGSAPGFTLAATVFNASLQVEQLEVRLQNAQIDLSRVQPSAVLGVLRVYYSDTVYGFQQLRVTDVSGGRASFDVVSFEGGGVTTVAQGQLIESPPTIVINALGQKAASLMLTTVNEEFLFSDNIFRLPTNGGFSLISTFTSVSAREDTYSPRRFVITNSFTTTNVEAGAPRIERLLPVHGEISRIVTLRGTGFDANPTNNQVTFAGRNGTRVPAEIVSQTNSDILIVVPHDAVTGPVRVTVKGKVSNDFSFFVRFHPDALFLFNSLNADTPTAPRLIHQQPIDDLETTGEVRIQTVIATLDKGRLALAGVTTNQQVGTNILVNFYTGRQSTNIIVYRGQETNAPQRHIFEVLPSLNLSLTLARIYALNDPKGDGVNFQIVAGMFPFGAGVMWDYRFATPIYRPPATAGTNVLIRMETVSDPWMAIPDSEMRRIENFVETVK